MDLIDSNGDTLVTVVKGDWMSRLIAQVFYSFTRITMEISTIPAAAIYNKLN